jgi:hypothetical protein
MTCIGFTAIGKAGYGYCQIMYVRVYSNMTGELCVCDYCHADAEGKRYIDPDVYFVGNGQVRLKSADHKRFDAMAMKAETMPLAVPAPKASDPVKPAALPAKKPVPAKKKVSLFDFKPTGDKQA